MPKTKAPSKKPTTVALPETIVQLPQELREQREREFLNLVNLLGILTDATQRLEALENETNTAFQQLIDDKKAQYSTLQATIAETEAALEHVAESHPEWFGEKASIKTPYGSVRFRKSTVLDVKNEEASIILIRQREKEDASFISDLYIRRKETLNLEALENLTDSELQDLRIKRVPKRNFGCTPAKVDLGKAVAAATKEAA